MYDVVVVYDYGINVVIGKDCDDIVVGVDKELLINDC